MKRQPFCRFDEGGKVGPAYTGLIDYNKGFKRIFRKIQFSKIIVRCIMKVTKEGDIFEYDRSSASETDATRSSASETDATRSSASVGFRASEIVPIYGR
ncbi:MAG: hypothetical protein NC079_08475 [Clostridium sp.]|nr:hypothetical protein [Acetatifactor muris]MCM1527351.1 hypothetical protein [Bacteroides sp.]MCM1563630.1 hypothetical protein [Clostridium sp.]